MLFDNPVNTLSINLEEDRNLADGFPAPCVGNLEAFGCANGLNMVPVTRPYACLHASCPCPTSFSHAGLLFLDLNSVNFVRTRKKRRRLLNYKENKFLGIVAHRTQPLKIPTGLEVIPVSSDRAIETSRISFLGCLQVNYHTRALVIQVRTYLAVCSLIPEVSGSLDDRVGQAQVGLEQWVFPRGVRHTHAQIIVALSQPPFVGCMILHLLKGRFVRIRPRPVAVNRVRLDRILVFELERFKRCRMRTSANYEMFRILWSRMLHVVPHPRRA